MNLNYRHLIICLLCFVPMLSFAQKVYEGQVVDSLTEEPLTGATVSLLKAKLTTGTDNQGYYRLIVNDANINDTLQFSFVGYKIVLLPVDRYQPKMFISLTALNNKLNQVNITGAKLKTLVLDKFNLSDIKDTRMEVMTKKGVVSGGYFTKPFYSTGTFAKTFESPQANVKLNAIDVGRRDFDIPKNTHDFPTSTTSKYASFLIHVILPHPVTGKLGKTIFTKEVNVTTNALKITIDVKDANIIIPTKKFFIAVEWLNIPINEIVKLNVGNKVEGVRKDGSQKLEEMSSYEIVYQPILVLFASGIGTYGWWSVDNKRWVFRDFRSPHPSPMHPHYNMALSATIVY